MKAASAFHRRRRTIHPIQSQEHVVYIPSRILKPTILYKNLQYKCATTHPDHKEGFNRNPPHLRSTACATGNQADPAIGADSLHSSNSSLPPEQIDEFSSASQETHISLGGMIWHARSALISSAFLMSSTAPSWTRTSAGLGWPLY